MAQPEEEDPLELVCCLSSPENRLALTRSLAAAAAFDCRTKILRLPYPFLNLAYFLSRPPHSHMHLSPFSIRRST